MKNMNSTVISFFITTALLILLEIITTTIFPILGLSSIRFSFFPLLVIFLSFYRNHDTISILIIAFSFIHSIFSIEAWYLSAFVGIVISVLISYFRDVIHLSNRGVTMFLVALLQMGMSVIKSVVFYLRGNNFEYIFHHLSGQLVELVILTVLAPYAFEFLLQIWSVKPDSIEEIA